MDPAGSDNCDRAWHRFIQAKSLKVYAQKYQPVRAVRTSMSDYREEGWLVNVPLYAIHQLAEILTAKKL